MNGGTTWTPVHELPSDAVTTIAIDPVSSALYVGTIGKGGCKLEIVNANGNITIEKE